MRSLVDGNLEGFRTEFESFLDRCPSFVGCVGIGRFLPVFFFSMFATAHDAGILRADEKVYFRFDNHGVNPRTGRNRNTGNLKVAVLTRNLDGQQVVRCYSISDVPNSDGLRFSTRERNALVREIRRQNPNLREEDLSFEQYKVCMHGKGKGQGEGISTVFEVIREEDHEGRSEFGEYSASEVNYIRREILHDHRVNIRHLRREIRRLDRHDRVAAGLRRARIRQGLDRIITFAQVAPGQQGIDNFIEMIAGNERQDVRDRMYEEILPYITRIYRRYADRLESDIRNRNQEFEGHGFLLGFLANFSHLHTIDIDLDLSTENLCVVFLVHRQEERENIPIVINVTRWRTPSGTALNHARGNAKRLHTSSFIPVHTESGYAVCVGLNFNLEHFSVETVGLQQDRLPFVQKLFERVRNRQDRQIQEETRNFLLHHLPREIPTDEGNRDRRFDYMTGFAFGSSAFDIHPVRLEEDDEAYVTKYIFRYNNQNLRRSVLTMVLHAQDSDVVILHIRASNDIQLEAIPLPQGSIAAVGVVTYTLNDRSGINSNAVRFNTPGDYLLGNGGNLLGGQLVEIPNAENVHGILEGVMNDDWQDGAQHGELFTAISRVLMPENMNGNAIIDVDSEDKFQSILHGVFYTCDNPDKVIAGYKVGQTYSSDIRMVGEIVERANTRVAEHRLDLLLLRQPTENDSDTHPIGYVLGFADNGRALAREQRNAKQQITRLMDKHRGYLPITSGNEVVLSYVIFNRGTQRAEDLISTQQLYVHRFDRRSRDSRPRGLVEPRSIIDENPPEGLLSDQTRENFRRFYEEKAPGQNSIFLLDIDDNLHVPFSYLQGTRIQAMEILRSRTREGDNAIPTAQGIRRQIRGILRNQRIEVNDLLTLEFATRNGHYDYWLQDNDILRAAPQYDLNNDNNQRFTVTSVGVVVRGHDGTGHDRIDNTLDEFIRGIQNDGAEQRRLTLIITLGNSHWVTLVIDHQNRSYVGYYADSLHRADLDRNNIPENIREALNNHNINVIHDVSIQQQGDDYNCGIWALENARAINQALVENRNVNGCLNVQVDLQARREEISEVLRSDNPEPEGLQRQVPDQSRNQVYELLRQYLQLGYHIGAGGSGGSVKAPSNLQSTHSGKQQEINIQAANDDQPDPSSELSEIQPISHRKLQRRHSV
ncbi:Ulp1 family isopeptidase [Wolbachia endosymbiont (group A) of Urophora cardui]|uniref:Ulp1 family isopeptidase n=1 Tax=Wolbachia endosymbiont (group A) of Urophora cardui TaxID=3066156 RepID=UPI0033424BC4